MLARAPRANPVAIAPGTDFIVNRSLEPKGATLAPPFGWSIGSPTPSLTVGRRPLSRLGLSFAPKVADRVAILPVSVTHGFSQVFENHELGRNRLKRFPKHHAKLATRLKPGVN